MKRILILWLPLLAVFWLARALLDAWGHGGSEPTLPSLLGVAAIPALQALAVGWLTRARGPSPALALLRALRHSPLLLALLGLDFALPALAWAFPDQAWLTPALGDAPDGNPASIVAALQALCAAVLFARLAARWPRTGPGEEERSAPQRVRALLAAFSASLALLAALLGVDALSLLGEVVLPNASPLVWKLCLHAPALVAGLALLFAVEPVLAARGEAARPALAALESAAACSWIAFLLSLLASVFAEASGFAWGAPAGVLALLGTTALVAAGRWAEQPDPAPPA